MNQNQQTVTAGLAAVLLGATAVGAVIFGIGMPLIVLGVQGLHGPAGVAIVIIGATSVAFGLAAGFAALAVAAKRPSGTVVGLGVGAVTVLGAAVASASGGWHPALIAAFLLGGGVVASLMAALRRPAGEGAAD